MSAQTKSFGTVIKSARQRFGYSQRYLAKLIDINFTYLSKLENNKPDYPPKEEGGRRERGEGRKYQN